MVVNADLDGVAGTSPMGRSVPVAGLGNGADVNYLDGIGIGLSLNCVNDVSRSSGVGDDGLGRIVVSAG